MDRAIRRGQQRVVKQRVQPRFIVGDDVVYWRHGVGYQATVREDLGVLRGAGRRYRVTTRDQGDQCNAFVFDVAERFLRVA